MVSLADASAVASGALQATAVHAMSELQLNNQSALLQAPAASLRLCLRLFGFCPIFAVFIHCKLSQRLSQLLCYSLCHFALKAQRLLLPCKVQSRCRSIHHTLQATKPYRIQGACHSL